MAQYQMEYPESQGVMQLPIVGPAPIVETHAQAFRHLFDNSRQFRHFQNYLTGLIVLENKSLANISRCILQSADKTNLSRFMSEAPWSDEDVNLQRLQYLLQQTTAHRLSTKESYLIIDDTLCEHVGGLFEYVARHYNHSDQRYPLAHNLVTSHYLSGVTKNLDKVDKPFFQPPMMQTDILHMTACPLCPGSPSGQCAFRWMCDCIDAMRK